MRIRRRLRWLARWTVWLFTGGALLIVGPPVLLAAIATPDWYAPTPELQHHQRNFLFVVGTVVVVVIAIATSRTGRQTVSSIAACTILPALALVTSLVATDFMRERTLALASLVDTIEHWATRVGWMWIPVLALAGLWGDTLRRRDLSEHGFAARLTIVGALSSVLCAVHGSAWQGFAWACFSPIVSAESAAWPSNDVLQFAALWQSGIAVGMALAICIRAARGARLGPAMLPPLGLLLWLIGRAAIDGIGWRVGEIVATGVRGAHLDESHVSTLAAWADAIGATSTSGAIACWLIAGVLVVALPGRARSLRAALSFTWPLLPLVWLVSSPALAPQLASQFPQQAPEAVWDEVEGVQPLTRVDRHDGYIPFYTTDARDVVVGVVTARGALYFFRDGRVGTADWFQFVDAPEDHFWGDGVELVFDRRATLGDLRQAARSLRRFASVSIVWRSNALSRAPRAAARWAFVDMASRALRARQIQLVPAACATPPHRQCPNIPEYREWLRDLRFIEDPDSRTIASWLDATATRHTSFALSLPDEGDERAQPASLRSERRRDPLDARWRPRDAAWAFVGILLAALVFGVIVTRDLAKLRALARSADAPEGTVTSYFPRWTRRRFATRRVSLQENAPAPYRTCARVIAVPTPARARAELSWIARRTISSTCGAVASWVLLALAATMLGLSLPSMLS